MYNNNTNNSGPSTSYQETANRNMYDDTDLYEYEPDSKNFVANAKGRVRQIFGSLSGSNRGDTDHSSHEYKRDILDTLCMHINQTLIVPKAFYFFFFAAFGSLFPLMAIYFKQMAMSPTQVGILLGFRPFVEFLSAPFWASISERWRKGRIILLGSMLCWIGFTLAMGFIKPPVHSCTMRNETQIIFEKYNKDVVMKNPIKRDVDFMPIPDFDNDDFKNYENEELNFDRNSNNNDDSAVAAAADLVLIGKRQIESPPISESEKADTVVQNGTLFQVLTYTKINVIKVKKNKTHQANSSSSSTNKIFNLNEAKLNNNKSPNEDKSTSITVTNENFQQKPKENEKQKPRKKVSTKTTTTKDAINGVMDEIAFSTIKYSKINQQNDAKIQNINSAVSTTVNELAKSVQKNDENDSDEDEDNDKNDKQLKTKSSEVTTTLEPKTNANNAASKTDKSHYFGDATHADDKDLVKPKLLTSIVYNKKDVRRVFLVFLFLLLAGEFFCAPAITLADTCTLQYLGPSRADLYGRQRMFGSLGWAIAMFCVGLLLDQSKAFTEHPCGQAGPDERNYTVCFAIYSVLMGCAFIIATQFKFSYSEGEQIPLKSLKQTAKTKLNKVRGSKFQQFDPQRLENEDGEYNEADEQYNVIDTEMPPARPPAPTPAVKASYSNSGFVEINSEELRKQKYKRLLQVCKSIKHVAFLFIVWFMGIGVGLVFTFLFWHLQGK